MAESRKSRRNRRKAGRTMTTASVGAPAPAAVPAEPQPIVVHPPVTGGAYEVDTDPVLEEPADAVRARAEVLEALPVLEVNEAPDVESADAPEPPAQGAPAAERPPRRAFSLDALRGLFLVAMTVGFTVRGDLFPQWMYHRQFPPPDFEMVPVAGIAWRDLTYVAFLFTMAAAIPITLSRRVARGVPELGIVFASVKRYALLLVYALLIGHSNTFFTGYTQTARAIAIAGFGVMALLFTRPRSDWNESVWRTLRLAGWVLAAVFLFASPLLYGSTFTPSRIDEVISGLAFASLAGALVWYFTRDNLTARLGVLAGAVALYLGARGEGWIQQWWWSSPAPWAFSGSKLGLLAIVVPGTIAGDGIRRWIGAREEAADETAGWSGGRTLLLAALAAAFAPVLTIGMYQREVLLTTQGTIAMLVVGLFLTAKPGTGLERLLRSLFLWGGTWLLLGLWLDPLEGGMKKVPETLSYFFAVTGVSMMLLVALTAIVESLGRHRWVGALVDVGQNPMLCYVLYTVLLNSALELVPPLRGVLRGSPGEIALRMLLETVAVVLLVRFFTRRHIYWRT